MNDGVPALIVHGGAGSISDPEGHRAGVRRAVDAGFAVLDDGGSALNAVLAAVRVLEDDPVFNAGTGSCLTLQGEVEMDAAVARGDGGFGAVTCVRGVRHPVDLARAVMERTDHLILAGEGAVQLARRLGFPPYNPVTEERLAQWRRALEAAERGEGRFSRRGGWYSTVGAAARDASGAVAAATSTGGIVLKLPGRVGDTPVPGAGTHAGVHGAASATGHGEGILRLALTRGVVEAMESLSAQEACRMAVDRARAAGVEAGVIGVDLQGRVGFAFNTPSMAWAYRVAGEAAVAHAGGPQGVEPAARF
ncbi:isoaspartyl peptidase/L-asparaginase family protein [Limnochorda pilosa]|uniref:Asparaginase n=1 Tax=Limnochorda pilosa TaxID=1555112 RepID=A0A0K2SGM2_LIMPI|nr:isoaspartyl peptidase/L-asparaginase [Limnochorda pilosa]BAS25994.1 asparaginase [Limnochorda pilosa]